MAHFFLLIDIRLPPSVAFAPGKPHILAGDPVNIEIQAFFHHQASGYILDGILLI
jgi:hypothetical protein